MSIEQKAESTRGDVYECSVCGAVVVVDEFDDPIGIQPRICCNKPMKKREAGAAPARGRNEKQVEPAGQAEKAAAHKNKTGEKVTAQKTTTQKDTPTTTRERVSAAGLQVYLKGINYPVSKDQLMEHAKAHGATETVMQLLSRFPDKSFERANEVSKEFGKIK